MPSFAHVSADLGLHSVESEVTGNKVSRRECFYFFPVLSFIPAVLTSLVDPVWTASTKATLWSELLNMCEKQVADLRGFLVQTLGQRGNNWVHVCNILQTQCRWKIQSCSSQEKKQKKRYLRPPLTTLLTGLNSAQLLFWRVSSCQGTCQDVKQELWNLRSGSSVILLNADKGMCDPEQNHWGDGAERKHKPDLQKLKHCCDN